MAHEHFQSVWMLVLSSSFIASLAAVNRSKAKQSKTKRPRSAHSTAKGISKFVFGTKKLKRYRFPTHINDLVIDRAQSLYSEVFMVVLEPDQAPPFHKHDENEQIFYVISGTGILTIGTKKERIPVRPGDVVKIPVSTFHAIRASNGETLKYLCVDCFGEKPKSEPTWDDHVKGMCVANGWDYSDVVSGNR